LNLWIKCLWV